ncbi:MAG: glycosyltransferase family 39 protein [Gemmatimonadales bacterium]
MASPRVVVWVCSAHLLLALLLFDPKPFMGGDNFWYMILGEGLRNGDGYRDFWLPTAPLHTRYPPVYPILLAVTGWFSNSVIAFKALSLACTTTAVGFTYALARRRTGDAGLALAAALLVAVAPAIVEYSHWELSEAPFLVLVTIALYAFARDPGGHDLSVFAAGSAAALAAYLTRSAGLPLLVAIAVALALGKHWRRLGWFAGASALVMLGWWLYVRSAAAEGAAYATYGQTFFDRDPYRPELGRATIPDLVGRVVDNLKVYALSAWPQTIGGRDVGRGLGTAVGVLLGGAVLAGVLRRMRTPGVLELFTVVYVGLILLWPQAWSDQRFLVPLVPLAALYLAEVVDWALPASAGRSDADQGPSGGLRPAHGVMGVAVAFALFANVRIAGPSLGCARAVLSGEPYACYPSAFADFVEASQWIRDHTEPGAVVISRKPQILYWYGRRPGDLYPYTTDADSLVRFLDARNTRYVVVDNMYGTTGRYLVPAIQQHATRFRLAHQEGNPPTYVLQYEGAAR